MAKFRQIRIDFPHHPRIRPLSSTAKLIHIFTTLPHVTGLARQSAKQLARQCGPNVNVADVEAAIVELTVGERPHAVWWEDEDVLWVVEAYDEQGSEAPSLRKHAAQWAQSFGPEIYARFCARYPWADDAQAWTRKKAGGDPAQLELEPELKREGERELELELERTLSHRVSVGVSDRVSDTVSTVQDTPPPTPPRREETPTQRPVNGTSRHQHPRMGKKPNASVLIAQALEQITSVASPSSGPTLIALEAISFNRATMDQVLGVYAAIAAEEEAKRPSDLGAIWYKQHTTATLERWLPPTPEDLEAREASERVSADREHRATVDRQRQREIDAGKLEAGAKAVGEFLKGFDP